MSFFGEPAGWVAGRQRKIKLKLRGSVPNFLARAGLYSTTPYIIEKKNDNMRIIIRNYTFIKYVVLRVLACKTPIFKFSLDFAH